MYSVPSAKAERAESIPRRLKGRYHLGWFVLTAILAFISVDMSKVLTFQIGQQLELLWHIDRQSGLEPFRLVLLFKDRSITLIAWWIVPGVFVACMQSMILIVNNYLDIRACIFVGIIVLLWGAHAAFYLLVASYVPELIEISQPNPLALIFMAWLFSSTMLLLASVGQWFLLKQRVFALPWVVSNGLGYSIGWSVGIYMLTTNPLVFDCICEINEGPERM